MPDVIQSVICPSCSASFKAKIPSHVAKGKCPRCQQGLTLSPDGTVRLFQAVTAVSEAVSVTTAEAPRENQNAPSSVASEDTLPVSGAIVAVETLPEHPSVLSSAASGNDAVVSAPAPLEKPQGVPFRRPTVRRGLPALSSSGAGGTSAKANGQPAEKSAPMALAIVLLILPPLVGGVLLGMKEKGGIKTFLSAVGTFSQKRFSAFFSTPSRTPPVKPRENGVQKTPPDDESKQPSAEVKQQLKMQIESFETRLEKARRRRQDLRTQKAFAPAEAISKLEEEIQQVQQEIGDLEKQIEDKKRGYKSTFHVEYPN